MNYEVILSGPAEKDFARLDKPIQKRIIRRLEELGNDPFVPRLSKTLEGFPDLRSSRVGQWRIIFTVHADNRVVIVVRIRSRGEVYRRLPSP